MSTYLKISDHPYYLDIHEMRRKHVPVFFFISAVRIRINTDNKQLSSIFSMLVSVNWGCYMHFKCLCNQLSMLLVRRSYKLFSLAGLIYLQQVKHWVAGKRQVLSMPTYLCEQATISCSKRSLKGRLSQSRRMNGFNALNMVHQHAI